jgi:hypothetical protein
VSFDEIPAAIWRVFDLHFAKFLKNLSNGSRIFIKTHSNDHYLEFWDHYCKFDETEP